MPLYNPTGGGSDSGDVVLDATGTDIAALGSQAAGAVGKGADAGHVHAMPRLDQVLAPTNPVSLNSQKLTSVANGSAPTDGAAFGQIPTALPPNGSASGDLAGSYPGPTVAKVQGVAITVTEATLVSDLNNAATRSATATVLPGEETIFTGTTAAQTLTLPTTANTPGSSVNTVTNTATVSVTLAPNASQTLSNFGTSGSIVIPAGYAFSVIFIGTTWYVTSAGPSDFATNNALAVTNGGTGQPTLAGAINAFAPPAWRPNDHGLIAWTFDPGVAGGNSVPALGVIQLCAVILRTAKTITNVLLDLAVTGTTLTSGENFAGLYTLAGTQVGVTADQTSNWGSTGLKTMALTSTYAAAAGTYWVAFVVNAATACQFARGTAAGGASTMLNAGLTASTARYATTGVTQTSLPASITPASNALGGMSWWAAVS